MELISFHFCTSLNKKCVCPIYYANKTRIPINSRRPQKKCRFVYNYNIYREFCDFCRYDSLKIIHHHRLVINYMSRNTCFLLAYNQGSAIM